MIELKVVDLLNAEIILTKIKDDATSNGTNLDLSYKIKRLLDKVSPEYAEIYAQRDKIFAKFGQKQEDEENGNQYRIPSEKVEQFQKYWEKLLNTDIELYNVFPFKLEDLEDLNGNYTLEEAHNITPFLDAPDWEEEPERSKINITFDDEAEEEIKDTADQEK